MRLALSATAWIPVGMPLGLSQDACIMVGPIVTRYAFAFPGLNPHATQTSFRSLGQSRVMPFRGDCEGRPDGRSWTQGRGRHRPHRVVLSPGSIVRLLHER